MVYITREQYEIALLVLAGEMCHFSKAIARMIIRGWKEQKKIGGRRSNPYRARRSSFRGGGLRPPKGPHLPPGPVPA